MNLENMDLTPEQMAKAKACQSPEELLALAKKEGCELSLDDLGAVAGGCGSPCNDYVHIDGMGDERDDIDESDVPAAFMTGEIRGDGLD